MFYIKAAFGVWNLIWNRDSWNDNMLKKIPQIKVGDMQGLADTRIRFELLYPFRYPDTDTKLLWIYGYGYKSESHLFTNPWEKACFCIRIREKRIRIQKCSFLVPKNGYGYKYPHFIKRIPVSARPWFYYKSHGQRIS